MDKEQINYYHEMKIRNRLLPLYDNGKLCALLTFYIGNGNGDNFVRDNPWQVVKDNENGNCCYIDQLLRNKNYKKKINSFKVWYNLKEFIKSRFPHIRKITWRRWRNKKTYRRVYGLHS